MGMASKETPGPLTQHSLGGVLKSLRELGGPRHLVEIHPISQTGTKALTCLIRPGALHTVWARFRGGFQSRPTLHGGSDIVVSRAMSCRNCLGSGHLRDYNSEWW